MNSIKLLCLAAISTSQAFLTTGSQAPNFENVPALKGLETGTVSLSDYKGKNLILVFYPDVHSNITPHLLNSLAD